MRRSVRRRRDDEHQRVAADRSVTHVRGRQTFKAGGGLILRRRYATLGQPAGPLRPRAPFTSNCAGRTGGLHVDARTRAFRSPASCSASLPFSSRAVQAPYTERRPEWSAYLQDDFGAGGRVTLNLGLRWDLFVTYVEDDDHQSNFDMSPAASSWRHPTRQSSGVRVGRYLQTFSKTDARRAWDLPTTYTAAGAPCCAAASACSGTRR